MSDLISRQAALDCFHDWIDRHGDVHTPDEMAEYRAIEELPSVELEKRTEECTETHACDLISRQAAIDALGEKPLAWTDGEYELALQQQWESDVDAIKAVPPAQPDLSEYSDKLWKAAYERGKRDASEERKMGKWIHGREVSREMIGDAVTAIFYEGWECSECHALVEDEREPLWKFCPNCGADMRGERDETD